MKRLILSVVCCAIGLGIANYFKFDIFGSFITGGIAFGIIDLVDGFKISAEKK